MSLAELKKTTMSCAIAFILPCDETVVFEWGMNVDLCCECLIKPWRIS